MLRCLTFAVSLLAFAGVAVADCGAAHSEKDAMVAGDKVLASSMPVVKATALPAWNKQGPACSNGNCDSVAKPAMNAKTAKKPVTPSEKERMLVANECANRPCQ